VRHVLRSSGIIDAVIKNLESGCVVVVGRGCCLLDVCRCSVPAPLHQPDEEVERASVVVVSDPLPKAADATPPARSASQSSPERSQRMGEGPRPFDPSRRYLRLTLTHGAAFVSEMGARSGKGFFVAHVSFRGQRFRGSPVPAREGPEFHETFLIDLHPEKASVVPPVSTDLASTDLIQLVVTKIVVSHGDDASLPSEMSALAGADVETELFSAMEVEWRQVLHSGSFSTPLELPGVGEMGATGVSAGVLTARLDIVPTPVTEMLTTSAASSSAAAGAEAGEDGVDDEPLRVDSQTAAGPMGLSEAHVMERVRTLRRLRGDAAKRFFVYARRWWDELLAERPFLRKRPVRIFAESENGTHKSVTTFVTPLRCGRLLDTPRHAARFVSLIPQRLNRPVGGDTTGGEEDPAWSNATTVLSLRTASCADHATLLCSLLRGWSMNAYVCQGTWTTEAGVESTHEWVCVLPPKGCPTFWEPLSGERLEPTWPLLDGRRFTTVSSLFNDAEFLVNVQPTTSVASVKWRLDDSSLWQAMDSAVLHDLRTTVVPPPALCPSSCSPGSLATALEACLRAGLNRWRKSKSLEAVPFNSQLEHCLGPALAAYENERITGASFGDDDFQASIAGCVPPKHTFRAFPLQMVQPSPGKILKFLRNSTVASEVALVEGEGAALAVRVRVFPYPENVVAVWVLLASVVSS
jgi:centrosomal protein CEP76